MFRLDATRQRRHLYAVVVSGVWVEILGEQGEMTPDFEARRQDDPREALSISI